MSFNKAGEEGNKVSLKRPKAKFVKVIKLKAEQKGDIEKTKKI